MLSSTEHEISTAHDNQKAKKRYGFLLKNSHMLINVKLAF